MWNVVLVFMLLFVIMWILNPTDDSKRTSKRPFRLKERVYRKNCSERTVRCIDDCSFLCTESKATCVGGVCSIRDDSVDCKTEYGGILVLTQDQNRAHYWKCLCTDSTFYGGEDCGDLVPDVCENGIFLYKKRNVHACVCDFPFVKIVRNDKPYCVKPGTEKFFDSSPALKQGPSEMLIY